MVFLVGQASSVHTPLSHCVASIICVPYLAQASGAFKSLFLLCFQLVGHLTEGRNWGTFHFVSQASSRAFPRVTGPRVFDNNGANLSFHFILTNRCYWLSPQQVSNPSAAFHFWCPCPNPSLALPWNSLGRNCDKSPCVCALHPSLFSAQHTEGSLTQRNHISAFSCLKPFALRNKAIPSAPRAHQTLSHLWTFAPAVPSL